MGDAQIETERSLPMQVAIVEVTDDTGRLVDRTPFTTQGDADRHAEAMRAKGLKATVSLLTAEPKAE